MVAGPGYGLIVSSNGGVSAKLPFTVTGTPGTIC